MIVVGENLLEPSVSAIVSSIPSGDKTTIGAPKNSELVSSLNSCHPEYRRDRTEWMILQLLLKGGDMLRSNAQLVLIPRPKEDPSVFDARIKRFSYQNILKTAVGWYLSEMFKIEPRVEFNSDDDFSWFLANCDGAGLGLVDFFKSVYESVFVCGKSPILVDGPEGFAANLQDERDKGLNKPYLVRFDPLSLINWETDQCGNYNWVVLKTVNEVTSFLKKGVVRTCWYYYDRKEFRVYQLDQEMREDGKAADPSPEARATLVREGLHMLAHANQVPVHCAKFLDNSWLGESAYLLLLDHLNQDNTYGWALFMSNLAMPVIIGNVTSVDMNISETGYLILPDGAKYDWSEPKGTSFTQSASRVETLREECFRSMYLMAQGRSSKATPAAQSGRSKEVDMVPARDVLSGHGDAIRHSMRTVATMVKEAYSRSKVTSAGEQPQILGFEFFEDMTTEEAFAVQSILNMEVPSRDFEISLYKKIIRRWTRDENPDDVKKMFQQVEAGPTFRERTIEMMKLESSLAVKAKAKSATATPGQGGVDAKPADSLPAAQEQVTP